jgi:hypothetical protein
MEGGWVMMMMVERKGERRSRKKRGEQFETGRGFSCGWRQASARLVFASSNDMSVNKEYLRSTVDRLVKAETVSTIYR